VTSASSATIASRFALPTIPWIAPPVKSSALDQANASGMLPAAHEHRHDDLEHERQSEHPAQRHAERGDELIPGEAEGEEHRAGGGQPGRREARQGGSGVGRPEHRDGREPEEGEQRHGEPAERRPHPDQLHDHRGEQHDAERHPAVPAQQVPPEVAGGDGEEHQGGKAGSAHGARGHGDKATGGGPWGPADGPVRTRTGGRHPAGQTNAAFPVIARPTMSVFISRVPS
jgi:hypothetical protein